jgi:uncharacterized repeat protein (TIGR01451 family)
MAGIRDIVRRGFVGSIAAIVTRGYGSIQATAPTITTTSLPGAGQNVAYTTTLEATGDVTITWAVTVGALPTGLTLSAAGILSGTPTTVVSKTFTVTATNDSGSDTQEYTLAVAAVSSGGGLARSGTAPTGRGLLRLSRG